MTLKTYKAFDSFGHSYTCTAFQATDALAEAKKALSGDITVLVLV